ncbi:peptidoglycan-binding protein LysM [Streptomyces avermitilis]|uniref:peptidoglycan-binding protein LysM n=1 Tax=Streptomyces avermitilis TaxID=33903 RepID=UPI003830820C
MGTNWISGVERLGDGSIGGAMESPDKPARVVWHTTESGAGDAAFKSVAQYLISIGAEPHFLYDPTTDRLAQYGPMGESARALKNDGSVKTNRTGKACIQIEVLARAGKPFTGYWKPGPNFVKLMTAIRSWGVPDVFPMGALASVYGDSAAKRTRTTWLSKGGHYGHCNVPGNDHWDPGAIDIAKLFAAAPVAAPKPTPTPAPTKPVVDLSNVIAARAADLPAATGHTTHKEDVLIVERALHAEGFLAAQWIDGSWGSKNDEAFNKFRRNVLKLGGTDATGAPGKYSLTELGKRHGFSVKA